MDSEESELQKKFEIIRLWKDGRTQCQILLKLGNLKTTVPYVFKIYQKYKTVKRIKGPRRKNTLDKKDLNTIKNIVTSDPSKTR